MADNTEIGRSQGTATIQGIPTEQYRFRTASRDVPIFTYSKNVAGRAMPFEMVSTAFKGSEEIYEEAPVPGNQLGFVYKSDGKGAASTNTGFFLMFKQGSLELADFSIAVPTTNEKVAVDADNINNSDVWLFALSANGAQLDPWTQVSNLTGNNIAYNSIEKNIKETYEDALKKNTERDKLILDLKKFLRQEEKPNATYERQDEKVKLILKIIDNFEKLVNDFNNAFRNLKIETLDDVEIVYYKLLSVCRFINDSQRFYTLKSNFSIIIDFMDVDSMRHRLSRNNVQELEEVNKQMEQFTPLALKLLQ
jgi:hypothetical protein